MPIVRQLDGTPSAPRCPSPPGFSPGRQGIPWTALPAPPDGAIRRVSLREGGSAGGFTESFSGVSRKAGEPQDERADSTTFSPAKATGGRGHGYLAGVLIWRGLGQALGRLAGVQHSAFAEQQRPAACPLLHFEAKRGLFLPRQNETSRRSRGESRSRSLAKGDGGRQGERRDPKAISPLDTHRGARPWRREPRGRAPGGERLRTATGEGGPGREGGNGGRTTTGDPASVQGRPLLLPVRSALPPASLPRLPRGAAALHKHGPAAGAGALRSHPDGGVCPAAGRGAAAGSAAAPRLRRQTGREAAAGSSGGLRAPPRAAALP